MDGICATRGLHLDSGTGLCRLGKACKPLRDMVARDGIEPPPAFSVLTQPEPLCLINRHKTGQSFRDFCVKPAQMAGRANWLRSITGIEQAHCAEILFESSGPESLEQTGPVRNVRAKAGSRVSAGMAREFCKSFGRIRTFGVHASLDTFVTHPLQTKFVNSKDTFPVNGP